MDNIVECINAVKTIFSSVQLNSGYLRAGSYIKNFEEELRSFNDKLVNVDLKVIYTLS